MTKAIWRKFSASISAGLILGGAAVAAAEVPATLTHQGRLFDAAGAPVNGNLTITFNIYKAEGDAAAAFTETLDVALEDGYFSATLGEVNSLKGLFDGQVKYLGVAIGNDPEMKPRAAVQSVPYAMIAGDAIGDIHPSSVTVNGVKVIDENGKWAGDMAGLAGPPGPMGPVGAQGLPGPQGVAGPAGATGPVGPMGAQGQVGAQGLPGPQGAIGPMGPAGPQGPAGPAWDGGTVANATIFNGAVTFAGTINFAGRVTKTANNYTGTAFANACVAGTNVCAAGYHPCQAWEAMVIDTLSSGPVFDVNGWVAGSFPNIDYHMRSLVNGQDSTVCPVGSHLFKYPSQYVHGAITAPGGLHCTADASSMPVYCCANN